MWRQINDMRATTAIMTSLRRASAVPSCDHDCVAAQQRRAACAARQRSSMLISADY